MMQRSIATPESRCNKVMLARKLADDGTVRSGDKMSRFLGFGRNDRDGHGHSAIEPGKLRPTPCGHYPKGHL